MLFSTVDGSQVFERHGPWRAEPIAARGYGWNLSNGDELWTLGEMGEVMLAQADTSIMATDLAQGEDGRYVQRRIDGEACEYLRRTPDGLALEALDMGPCMENIDIDASADFMAGYREIGGVDVIEGWSEADGLSWSLPQETDGFWASAEISTAGTILAREVISAQDYVALFSPEGLLRYAAKGKGRLVNEERVVIAYDYGTGEGIIILDAEGGTVMVPVGDNEAEFVDRARPRRGRAVAFVAESGDDNTVWYGQVP